MQLVQEGKLDLKATIGRYLPDYPGEGKTKVTIYQLLTYGAGIPNCEHLLGDSIYKIRVSKDDFIKEFCSDSLEATPGSKFNYDNGVYIILGRVLEQVSGQSYRELLKRRILKTLNMTKTGFLSTV